MRAARRERYGPPTVIRVVDAAPPSPKDHEILVRVRAATVSRTDCALLAGRPLMVRAVTGLSPRKKILGTDFAGEVEAIGKNVTRFAINDRVWGFNDLGMRSHAEYLIVSAEADRIAPLPIGAAFDHAVASLEGAFYAYNFINKVDVGPHSRIMINGATGAIGSALLQLSKYFGATVTAVGNTKNLDLLASLGADRVIDYLRSDFTHDDGTYDYVFDAVGKSTFNRCRPLLTRKGVYISSELGPGWQNPWLSMVTPLFRRRRVVFPIPTDLRGFLAFIRPLVEENVFKAVVDRHYPLDAIQEAYEYAASGQKTGQVVLTL